MVAGSAFAQPYTTGGGTAADNTAGSILADATNSTGGALGGGDTTNAAGQVSTDGSSIIITSGAPVTGGNGAAASDGGSAGAALVAGGAITVNADLTGGTGGTGTGNTANRGGQGGAGAFLGGYGTAAYGQIRGGTLTNSAGVTISGGAGGAGFSNVGAESNGFAAGDGGHGVIGNNMILTNNGTITGGNGGNGGNATTTAAANHNGGDGGVGGVGLLMNTANSWDSRITNYGIITGGNGGAGGNATGTGVAGNQGTGGIAVRITGENGVFYNASGALVQGGTGSGPAAVGIVLDGTRNHVINDGRIYNAVDTATNTAINVTGTANTVEIWKNFDFQTNLVTANSGNHNFVLGGTENAAFDMTAQHAGNITGFTTNYKRGASTWMLGGANTTASSFSNNWFVEQGALGFASNATLNLNANQEVTVKGTGTLVVGNNMALGEKATINDGAGLKLEDGATLRVYNHSVAGTITADEHLHITGTGNLAAGNVKLNVEFGTFAGWQAGSVYNLITADGTSDLATFQRVDSNSYMTSWFLNTDAANEIIQLNYVGDRTAASAGRTFNQISNGMAIDSLNPATSELYRILKNNAGLKELQYFEEQGHGVIHANVKNATFQENNLFAKQLLNHSSATISQTAPAAGNGDKGSSLWVTAGGSYTDMDSDDNAAESTYEGTEFTIGYDYRADSGLLLGAALRFAKKELDVTGHASKNEADVDTVMFGLYGGHESSLGQGMLRLTAGGTYGRHDVESERRIDVLSIHETNKADYKLTSYQLFGEAAYNFEAAENFFLEPYLNLSYIKVKNEQFFETGGPLTSLNSASKSSGNFSTTLGSRMEYKVNERFDLNAELAWQHTYGTLEPESVMAFNEGGGSQFLIKGAPLSSDAAIVGAGLDVGLTDNTALNLNYMGAFGTDSATHAGQAVFSFNW